MWACTELLVCCCRTYLYSEFDSRSWSAHLGMGNETAGYAIAGEGCNSGS